jgi:hypothetical protein
VLIAFYYDAYNLLMTYYEQGEFDNGIIYHNKALAIEDNIIPEEFQSKATRTII